MLNPFFMNKIFVYTYFLVLATLLNSCSVNDSTTDHAEGGKVYGGTLKFMSADKVDNLSPYSNLNIYSQRFIAQMFEPLLKLDMETMKVVPNIAESYSVSKDARTFTFKIRKGVYFHEDPCFDGNKRFVTVEDVKYSLELACSGLRNNKLAYLLVDRIEGAREFYSRTQIKMLTSGISGIKIKDDNTIEIRLLQPFVGFDKILSHSNLVIIPREAYEYYGNDFGNHPVGTGPFMFEKMDKNGITLIRNPKYWRKDEVGNQLPFLDKIQMSYVKNKRSELIAFRKKQIDVVLQIPVEEIENILGTLKEAQAGLNVKHRVESKPSLSVNYVAFACESPEFKDDNIRRAFNLAIDRKKIVNQLLMGEGWVAEHGFVPPLDNYHSENVIGHKFDVVKARQLMASAGYPNGKGFPELDFYVNSFKGSSEHKMCEGVVADLKKNLNVKLNIKLCTYQERNKAVMSGKAKIWRSGWIADYPDAENFLSLFYGKNIKEDVAEVNASRFRDSNYDQLFEIAMKELSESKRNEYFELCDQIIVDKAPVMPLLNDDFMVMINARVRDLKINSLENLDFSSVYIKEPKQ
jgi:oligopeptide transport system substrate-binding protein